jgi:hypothetical protein
MMKRSQAQIATQETGQPFAPERRLWAEVLIAQMTGSKAGVSACRAFWFSEHCRKLCAFLDLNVEVLQQAATDPTPMHDPSPITLYCDPAESWRQSHKKPRRRTEQTVVSASGWRTGPNAVSHCAQETTNAG